MSTLYEKRRYLPWKAKFSQKYPEKTGILSRGQSNITVREFTVFVLGSLRNSWNAPMIVCSWMRIEYAYAKCFFVLKVSCQTFTK